MAWQQVSVIWERNPIWRVEIVWLLIAIVVTAVALAWLATFVVMSIRLQGRTRREYPDNVAAEIAQLEAELAMAMAEMKHIKVADRQLRYIVKVVREAVITEPTRMITE